jgi:predicted ATPase
MLIHNLAVRGLLSFGRTGLDLPLSDLNVLIGPNGSGKSNFIEVLSLLRATCEHLSEPMFATGGVREWFWKGNPMRTGATIEVSIEPLDHFIHKITLFPGGHVTVMAEVISEVRPGANLRTGKEAFPSDQNEKVLYSFDNGKPFLVNSNGEILRLDNKAWKMNESVLAQIKDPTGLYDFVSQIQSGYESICLFRNWSFGPSAAVRHEQPTSLRSDYLSETAENLPLVLSKIKQSIRVELREALHELGQGIEDVDAVVENGAVQLYLAEGGRSIPMSRLSDGTLRYLCLLAILLHPDPPALVVIEEPELGLHPDILPYLGKLIKKASRRMQLVITTHSQILLDSFSKNPEDVIVCSRGAGESKFERLNDERLADWLKDHTLGELWNMGEIGGTRW